MTYKEKFIQMNKEAKATWIVGAVMFAFWAITGFGTAKMDYTIFYMPGWFVVSSFGVWILSIALTWFLAAKVFKNFDLDEQEDEVILPKEDK
jgi:uncharacterized membrane protein YhdT